MKKEPKISEKSMYFLPEVYAQNINPYVHETLFL